MQEILGTEALPLFDESSSYHIWLYEQFSKYMGDKVIEVGAGRGHLTDRYIKKVEYATLTEFDPDCRKFLDIKYKSSENINILNVDLTAPHDSFSNYNHFDTVISCNVLEHLEDDSNSFPWMRDILKSKGKLILILPAHQFLFGAIDVYYGHFRRYDKPTLIQKLTDNQFNIRECFYFGKFGAIGWFIKGSLFRQGKINSNDIKFKTAILPFIKFFEKICPFDFGHNVIAIAEKP